ncbi:polymerase [Devosia sp. Leaf64]|nr:polymerase [Devosia sp. Leaf64]
MLFVAVFCYFWIGISPLSDPKAGTLAAYGDTSNALNQLIVLAMSMLVMTMLALHPSRELVLRAYWPLAAIFLWIALTIPFADSPDSAIRRSVYSLLVCICASAVLLLPRDTNQFARLVGICLFLAVGLSYLGVIVLPARAIHQATDLSEQALAGDWRGHFGHKNTAAAAMAFAVFFGFYLMKMQRFWIGLVLVVLAGVFVLNSGGKTAAAMLPAVLVATWIFERAGPMRLVLVVGTLIVFNAIILTVAVSPPVAAFVSGLGIDASFTDRTSIWQLALSAVADRPLTGYGFQSFWQTDALFYGNHSASTWAVTAANAHNGYVDQLINGGWPLLILILIWIVILPCRQASVALARGTDPDLTRLYLRIWLFGLLTSCLESPIFENSGPLWFTLLIAVFGLRLQATAGLVGAAPQLEPRGPRFAGAHS